MRCELGVHRGTPLRRKPCFMRLRGCGGWLGLSPVEFMVDEPKKGNRNEGEYSDIETEGEGFGMIEQGLSEGSGGISGRR